MYNKWYRNFKHGMIARFYNGQSDEQIDIGSNITSDQQDIYMRIDKNKYFKIKI